MMKKTVLILSLLLAALIIAGCDNPVLQRVIDPGRENTGSPRIYPVISYNPNGGYGSVPASQTAEAGSYITVAGPGSLSYPGMIFGGWNTDSSGYYGTIYQPGSSLYVDRNIILWAIWISSSTNLTVSYYANGGYGTVPIPQTVAAGSTVTVAAQGDLWYPYPDMIFGGWDTDSMGYGVAYQPGDSLYVNNDITLYAVWTPSTTIPLEYRSLAEKLAWINISAENGARYVIELDADETLSPITLSCWSRTVGITLRGNGSERIVSLNGDGYLFNIDSGITLTLDNNITLRGRGSNSQSLVHVSGGTLVMNEGSKISNNDSFSSPGGGVYVSNFGTFTMVKVP
jgi:hypothetical protein